MIWGKWSNKWNNSPLQMYHITPTFYALIGNILCTLTAELNIRAVLQRAMRDKNAGTDSSDYRRAFVNTYRYLLDCAPFFFVLRKLYFGYNRHSCYPTEHCDVCSYTRVIVYPSRIIEWHIRRSLHHNQISRMRIV